MKSAFVFSLLVVLVAVVSLADARCRQCPRYSQPVCGVNRVTYSNHCYLNCNSVQLAHVGTCRGGYTSGYGYRPRAYPSMMLG